MKDGIFDARPSRYRERIFVMFHVCVAYEVQQIANMIDTNLDKILARSQHILRLALVRAFK